MKTQTNKPKIRFKTDYKKNTDRALIFTLVIVIFIFQGWKSYDTPVNKTPPVKVIIETHDLQPIIQQKDLPRPSRPAIPVESEDPDFPPNETIDDTRIDLGNIPQPPEFKETVETKTEYIFIAYEQPPVPVGGYLAIQKVLKYPKTARKAQVEGTVRLWVCIDESGQVVEVKVLKSLGNTGCDEAAVAAVKSVKWQPALQRDKPVKVWISIPVKFMLK
ncbi:energy transducer TonB [candidate division KSB1 bacterium]|nr:energy transducer TonB [candidate division KSB1 bacterium]